MSTQSDALLGLVGAYRELSDTERTQRWAVMFGNPVICTPRVYQLALADADDWERPMLEKMRQESLLVVADDPAEARVRLQTRVGYQNRETRRATRKAQGKPGKGK